jgi:glutamine amidotransferase PdxT
MAPAFRGETIRAWLPRQRFGRRNIASFQARNSVDGKQPTSFVGMVSVRTPLILSQRDWLNIVETAG